ncbi:hypothetical protein [Lysobacter sp.]|uniref:hypothetical protein n=1 Tax=Lysobacter sp. TaxID=72226 RepID=UPI002D791C14|nr:hypothetical protein [Lysobacter sp.]
MARKSVTPAEVLALFMELDSPQRTELAEWIRLSQRTDLWLEGASVRRHTDEEIGRMFGTRKLPPPWAKSWPAAIPA